MRVVVVCGSRREDSMTKRMTDVAYEAARKQGGDVHYVDLRTAGLEDFRGFGAGYSKETLETVKLMESADVFLLGSPVYDGLLSSGIKNLFEHVNYKALEGAVAGFMIKGSTQKGFLAVEGQLASMMSYFRVVSNPRSVFASDSDFEGGELAGSGVKERILQLVESTVRMARGASR